RARPAVSSAAPGTPPAAPATRRAPLRLALLPLTDLVSVLALAVGGWLQLRYGPHAPVEAFLKTRRGTLYGAALSVHAGLLGFVLATTTVVLGYAQSERFEVLRASRHYRALYRTLTAAIGMFALATVTTLAA